MKPEVIEWLVNGLCIFAVSTFSIMMLLDSLYRRDIDQLVVDVYDRYSSDERWVYILLKDVELQHGKEMDVIFRISKKIYAEMQKKHQYKARVQFTRGVMSTKAKFLQPA